MSESVGILRLDFARGLEAPRWVTVAPETNDEALHRLVCPLDLLADGRTPVLTPAEADRPSSMGPI